MKIAILSDIHGNIPALEAVEADMRRRGVNRVYNLGDHLSGPLWPAETLHFLMKRDWTSIAGNHDRNLVTGDRRVFNRSDTYAYEQLEETGARWLASLPKSFRTTEGHLLVHGTPASDSTYLLETVKGGGAKFATPAEVSGRLGATEASLVLCGHSHIPRIVETRGGMLIVNPGSVGLQAYDDELPEYHVIEAGSGHARYAVIECLNGRLLPEIVAVDYDRKAAAAQAAANGREDWRIGIMTGYMEGWRT